MPKLCTVKLEYNDHPPKMTSRNFSSFLIPPTPTSRFLFKRLSIVVTKFLIPPPLKGRDVIYGEFLLLRPEHCFHIILNPLPPKTATSFMDDPYKTHS